MTAIVCEGLTKHYGPVVGLDGLDLVVPKGTIFGFLGPNGAGKTTTIRLLIGLSRPTSGQAWVAGHTVPFDDHALRAQVGHLGEEPSFYRWMTGRELLTYVGRLFGMEGRALAERVDELLEVADLSPAARRRIGGYSRGMRQRLGIAQAMINRPPVLLLDEPCSALDPIGRKEILEIIASLRGQATVFMSTHILADVERVCDEVAIIDRGRLVVQAPINDLRKRYAPPVFVVQLDASEDQVAALADDLRKHSWALRVEVSPAEMRFFARDLARAKGELPGLIAASGLTLLRYELVLPSLEDVFVRLMEGER